MIIGLDLHCDYSHVTMMREDSATLDEQVIARRIVIKELLMCFLSAITAFLSRYALSIVLSRIFLTCVTVIQMVTKRGLPNERGATKDYLSVFSGPITVIFEATRNQLPVCDLFTATPNLTVVLDSAAEAFSRRTRLDSPGPSILLTFGREFGQGPPVG